MSDITRTKVFLSYARSDLAATRELRTRIEAELGEGTVWHDVRNLAGDHWWFVAAQGSDSNPCTLALPCRTLQHAHDAAQPDGVIDVLGPADYSSIAITKPISIQGHGFASISAPNFQGCAVTINIPSSGNVVNLRGLLIDGDGSGGCGIQLLDGTLLSVQESLIRNFRSVNGGYGIWYNTATSSDLYLSDTLITETNQGILIRALGSPTLSGMLERVAVVRSQYDGIDLNGLGNTGGAINFTISRSTIGKNGGNGIAALASPTPASAIALMVRDSAIANNNGTGISAQGSPAFIQITRSTITGNGTGFGTISGGQIVSFGDNSLAGNGTDGIPTSTISLQ
jgi:hypothetical protein